MATIEKIKLFINEYNTKYDEKTLTYTAGQIYENGDIGHYQFGAEETFSIGMPVYSEEGKELGKLSLGLFHNLNYHAPDCNVKIPVYVWRVDGYKGEKQKIKTYYQVRG